MKNSLYLFLAWMVPTVTIMAQSPANLETKEELIQSVASKIEGNWIWLRKDKTVLLTEFFKKYGRSLNLSTLDSMRLKSTLKDNSGVEIFKYDRYHQGLLVEYAEFILEVKDGRVTVAHGQLFESLNLSTSYSATEHEALTVALSSVGAEKYIWQDSLRKADISQLVTLSLPPKGDLIFANFGPLGKSPKAYQLVYKFEITSTEPWSTQVVYIDAVTNKLLRKESRVRQCFKSSPSQYVTGTFVPLHPRYGSQLNFAYDANKMRDGSWVHYVRDISNNMAIQTWQDRNSGPAMSRVQINYLGSGNGYTITPNYNWGTEKQNGTTALWALQRTYAFFQTLGRSGLNGNNAPLTTYVNWNDDPGGGHVGNAQYYNSSGYDYIRFGTRNAGGGDAISIDVAAHEYTHGVTHYTSNLAYQGFSGALNEAFSDMFGITVEQFALGGLGNTTVPNWVLGDDIRPGGLRDLQFPNSLNQPGTIGDAFWIDPVGCVPTDANDFCWVHRNSGIPNRWFQLISTSPNLNVFQASTIAYNTLLRLTATSDFNDARNASIQYTNEIWTDACNPVITAVTNSWAAVGVGANFVCGGRSGVGQDLTEEVAVFPNPSSDQITVRIGSKSLDIIANGEGYIVSLYDLIGRKVFDVKGSNSLTMLDVSNLKSGLYFVEVRSTTNKILSVSKKVVIQH